MASQSGVTSSGPFTCRVPSPPRGSTFPSSCPTCPSVPAITRIGRLQRLTCPRQHPFGPGASSPVSGQLSTDDQLGGGSHIVRGFLLPFGHRHSLLGHPVPPRNSASPHGRPTGRQQLRPDPDGVSTFRTHETRPGSGALSTPGRRCLHGRRRFIRPPPAAFSSGQSCTPVSVPSPGGSTITRHHKGSLAFTRPAFPSPVTPGWNGGPWASP